MGRWMQIESAKRRLFYSLARLGLEPAPGRSGPVFDLLAEEPGGPPVLTGHHNGTITLNVGQEEGADVLKKLLADADVLIENFRVGTLELGRGLQASRASFVVGAQSDGISIRNLDKAYGKIRVLHGINLSDMKTGDRVLVLGAGPIGLAVAFWAKRLGAARVAVQDISPFQQDRALDMGADVFVVDPQNPVGSAEAGLGGKADIVFECVGLPGLIAQAVDQVRPRGTILLLGLCTKPDTFNSFAMLSKEVRLVTSAFFTVPEYEATLAALEGGADAPRLLVTGTVDLLNTPTMYESLKKRTEQCKVLIAP